ncbi:hypothetical protein CTKZ_05120 [Cellulomonas algicola]|uniref:Uncharacterized protein n=2 Tax=Cellulomonas algicola TaxID=2071633 RepID=A0A401UWI3_9CELL|nr:hypothetical protein CTKZ_05120 [Cellulomonas algicola]
MNAASTDEQGQNFTAEERAAMKERAKEVRTAKRKGSDAGLADVLEKIAEMPDADREIAERIHAIVTEVAPDLQPKTWYGQPAYAKNGKVVLFFQASSKFKTRYATLGFNEDAALDDGELWPTAFAITAVTSAVESTIRDLVARAAG